MRSNIFSSFLASILSPKALKIETHVPLRLCSHGCVGGWQTDISGKMVMCLWSSTDWKALGDLAEWSYWNPADPAAQKPEPVLSVTELPQDLQLPCLECGVLALRLTRFGTSPGCCWTSVCCGCENFVSVLGLWLSGRRRSPALLESALKKAAAARCFYVGQGAWPPSLDFAGALFRRRPGLCAVPGLDDCEACSLPS